MARLFSVKRLILSIILGFLLPTGYAVALWTVFGNTGKKVPDFMGLPIAWPRPLLIFLLGRKPSGADVLTVLLVAATCNTLLYGTIVYVALLMLDLFRGKPVDYGQPPPPEDFRP